MSPEHATRSFSVLLTDDETLAREMEEGTKEGRQSVFTALLRLSIRTHERAKGDEFAASPSLLPFLSGLPPPPSCAPSCSRD